MNLIAYFFCFIFLITSPLISQEVTVPQNAKSSPSHEQMIHTIISSHFKQTAKFINRMTIGICNEVYTVGLHDQDVIVRLSSHDKFLMGSHDHIPKFEALGINVPKILAEDYIKNAIPLSYQVQSKVGKRITNRMCIEIERLCSFFAIANFSNF